MKLGLAFLVSGVLLITCETQETKTVQFEQWVTTADKSMLLEKVTLPYSSADTSTVAVIIIDSTKQFQSIDGFGYALTGGSAMLLHTKLTKTQRDSLFKELFHETGIGISYLRISIGASDLDEFVFSYDDLPKDKTDPTLSRFNLSYDTLHLIPILKEILSINPNIKLMGSPWSPPVWMKTNQDAKGGSLKPEFYDAYARYFVKYIQSMAKGRNYP